MSELNEIMNGKHDIKHLRIEGETIAFETELDNYTWNLSSRDIEQIIYSLQQKVEQLENIRKEAIEYVKDWQSFPHTNCTTHNELNNLLNILNKGSDKE